MMKMITIIIVIIIIHNLMMVVVITMNLSGIWFLQNFFSVCFLFSVNLLVRYERKPPCFNVHEPYITVMTFVVC